MLRATTVLAVRHKDQAVMASDGQVTFGDTVVKQSAKKIRRLYNDRILAGFAGSAADSEEYPGAAVRALARRAAMREAAERSEARIGIGRDPGGSMDGEESTHGGRSPV